MTRPDLPRPDEPSLPALDDACSRHFTYRDLICCGESWQRLRAASSPAAPFDNLPHRLETYEAIRVLCATILDPVVERFGPIELTYAFASPALTRRIPSRIAPALDQHAGHETNRAGKPICPRLGLAADIFLPGLDSRRVAAFLVEHTPFDRLYLYGPDRPLHVSAGPDQSRRIIEMRRGPSGRLIPRALHPNDLRTYRDRA